MTFLNMIFGRNKNKVIASISLSDAKANLLMLGERIAEFGRVLKESELKAMQEAHAALKELIESSTEEIIVLTPENLAIMSNVENIIESEITPNPVQAPLSSVSQFFEGVPSFYSSSRSYHGDNEEQQDTNSLLSRAYEYSQILYEMKEEVTSNIARIGEEINISNNQQELAGRRIEQQGVLAIILEIQRRVVRVIEDQEGASASSSQNIADDPMEIINSAEVYIRDYYGEERVQHNDEIESAFCSAWTMFGWMICLGISVEVNELTSSGARGGFDQDNFT